MNCLNSMLGVGWTDIITNLGAEWSWLSTLLSTLQTVLWVLLLLVGAAGAIYATKNV